MNLFILRHASAGVRRTNPLLDRKRPLDKEGKRQCLQLAEVLNHMKVSFDLIVSSPLKRCMQTASFVGTETGYEAKILPSAALAPEASLPQFQNLLSECSSYENLLVVGHNPNLTAFLAALIAQTPTAAPLQAAGVAALSLPLSYYQELTLKYTERRHLLHAALTDVGFKAFSPHGAYYIIADISAFNAGNDRTFARHLVQTVGVATVPGSSFYRHPEHGAHQIRFTFCKTLETLHRAVENLQKLRKSL